MRPPFYWRAQLSTSTLQNMAQLTPSGNQSEISHIPETNPPPNLTDRTITNEVANSTLISPEVSAFNQYRDNTGFQETPFGQGRLSEIPDSPEISVVTPSSVLEQIREEVDQYGTQLINKENWTELVETEFRRLNEELISFEERCLREHDLVLVERIQEVVELLIKYNQDLHVRAKNQSRVQLRPPRIQVNASANPNSTPQRNLHADLEDPDPGEDVQTAELESRHGLIELIKEVMGTELGEPLDVSTTAVLINKIPQLEKTVESIKAIQDIPNLIQNIDKFNQRFGSNSDFSVLMEDNGRMKSQIEQLTTENRELKDSVTGLSSKVSDLTTSYKQLEISFKSVTRWLGRINDNLPSQATPQRNSENTTARVNSNVNQQTQGTTSFNAGRTERLTECIQNPSSQSTSRSHPCTPTRNSGPRNLVNELRIARCTLDQGRGQSPNSSSSESNGPERIFERRINRIIDNISTLIDTDLTTPSEITDECITDLHSNVEADVARLCKECDDCLIRYVKLHDYDLDLADRAGDCAVKGYSWISELKRIYRDRQLHLQSDTSKLISDSLKKFTGDSSQTVYEFLKRFEQFTQKYTHTQRALLLYGTYLDTKLKQELVAKSQNYQEMKEWLIKRFGQIKGIVNGKLNALKTLKHPSDDCPKTVKADYYRQVYSVLSELQNLHVTSDIPKEDLDLYIYTHDAIEKVLKKLPGSFIDLYMAKLFELDKDPDTYQGKSAFDQVMKLVERFYFSAHNTAKIREGTHVIKEKPSRKASASTPPKKSVNMITKEVSSDSEDDQPSRSVHYQNAPKKKEERKQRKPSKSSESSKTWHDPSLKFPCPIKGHKHEIGTCKSFFGLEPKERKKSGYKKICYSCLGPREKCKERCINVKRLPNGGRMACLECSDEARKIKKSPFNVLVCPNKEHTKLTMEDLLTDCEKWFPNFKASEMKTAFPASVNLVAVTMKCHACKSHSSSCHCIAPPSLSSPVDEDADIPNVDTCTGENVDVEEDMIIKESSEESVYIMQLLDMRGSECLTFYDRGANEHLIDGELAERVNLKVITSRNQSVGVMGGGTLWTEYGKYCVRLGPTIDGKFHEMKCQGIKRITTAFPLYDLTEVSTEVRKSKKLSDPKTILPKYIGGHQTHLLLGIKDTLLDPDKLFTLPCGLGVYQSQLMDKFKSRICYGGPHRVFSEANKATGGSFNHVSVFFTEVVNAYRSAPYPALARIVGSVDYDDRDEYVITPVKKTSVYSINVDVDLDIHPTPLTAADFHDFGCEAVDERDTVVNDSKRLETLDLDTCLKPGDFYCSVHRICTISGNLCSIHKAKVSVSKQLELADQDDIDSLVNYRCPECSKCLKCKESNRTKSMSLRETMEQDLIEKSVRIDTDSEKVIVDLPFTQDPVKFLTNKHGGSDNKYQALKVYKSQCRKSEATKEGIRKVHKDLVDKGFMVKLTDLSQEQQDIIASSAFKHYYPWTTVAKPDSVSTPVRLVVDPSRTGLNIILAKGENNMAKSLEILIRNRCCRYMWTSDISKLYNQLHMMNSSLAYQLFLFSNSLDENEVAEIWALVRGWYGTRSTGAQAGEALRKLADIFHDKYPFAAEIVRKNIYVDDIMSGANDKAEFEEQISQTQALLKKGGFKMKFIVRTGENPSQEASSDGQSLKILGYKWHPKEDTLGFGFQEINFNKKQRGEKKPNPFPVVSPDDVSKLLDSTLLSKRCIVSKVAELYDPVGLWEPYKLQLKLEISLINSMAWDTPLPPELQNHWKQRFNEFLDIPTIFVNRCVIPENAIDPSKIRLICLSDAAVYAGGAAIYAGYELPDGSFSCQLLTSKSQLMDMSIPRNELEGVSLMCKLAFIVSKSLGNVISNVLFFTDSTCALSWCHNLEKKLKMYVHNRVSTIRRYVNWITPEADPIPLYHIDGKLNIADLLTKSHDIKPQSLDHSSEWQNGLAWMTLKVEEMPITHYKDLTVSKTENKEIDQECFLEPMLPSNQSVAEIHEQNGSETHNDLDCSKVNTVHCMSCKKSVDATFPPNRCYGKDSAYDHCDDCSCKIKHTSSVFVARKGSSTDEYLVPIIEVGWRKAIEIMSKVVTFSAKLIHSTHMRTKNFDIQSSLENKCQICHYLNEKRNADGTQITRNRATKLSEEYFKYSNLELGKNYFYRKAGTELEKLVKQKTLDDNYTHKDGIYYYAGRLSDANPVDSANLDFTVFFDNTEIKSILPVVPSSSQVFYSYLIYVHDYLRPHSGIELTMREVSKEMHAVNSPRRVIARVRKDCIKCKIIFKKTLELKMGNHGPERTLIAPPFYNCQMDIAYGFTASAWKNARKTFQIYALVIVCLLTSATNILVLEGIETQDVVQALERHSSRFGVPAKVYVDSGSQLVNLDSASFSLRDVDAIVYDNIGLQVKVSAPKSHEERGRVEAKIKIIRQCLLKLSVKGSDPMTTVAWETLFSKIANQIDDVPFALGSSSNVHDFGKELLTANRIKLGRNNYRSLEGSISLNGATEVKLLQRNREIQKFFYQLILDRLHHLIPRPPKWNKSDSIKQGDICVFVHTDSGAEKRWSWQLGRVTEVIDERKIKIEYFTPSTKRRMTVTRCPRQVSKIYDHTDLPVNTVEYYEKSIIPYKK